MTKPDFMKKQLIFIESDETKKIKFRNSNLILVDENNKIVLQNSCYKIFVVFVYGEFSITSVMIKNAKKFGINFVFMNYSLKPYFQISPDNIGNSILRKKQYINKNEFLMAKYIVKNKIMNQLILCKSLRYKTKEEKEKIKKFDLLLKKIDLAKDTNKLMSFEGNASKLFFSVYFKNMNFQGRKPRVKSDIYNLLLDIGYNFLFNFIDANLSIYGFDLYCGFYHKFFYQRKSLVCDLVEPFRCIIDKKLRNMFNLKQINENDFGIKNLQYYIKKDHSKKYSKLFLREILDYKEDIFIYIQKFYRAFVKDLDVNKYPKFLIKEDLINNDNN